MVCNINSARVLIVDELRILRRHFGAVLDQAGMQSVAFREAPDSLEALEQISLFSPDVIVLDPGSITNVMAIIAKVRATSVNAKFLFWCSGHWQPVVRMIERTNLSRMCCSYILKSRTEEDLALALRCVVERDGIYLDPTVREALIEPYRLTDMDYDIVSNIALGLTDKVIAIRSGTSSRTIQYRVATAFAKILRLNGLEQTDYMLRNGFLNARVRIVTESLRQGVLSLEHIEEAEASFQRWSAENLTARKQ